jgi:GntR family transcriptional regulator, rspAB operon transcriptional repressor
VRGVLRPGQRVTEPALADMLRLSWTPVREAMHRLQHEGLLVRDGGGARPRMAVAPLDAAEARALYQTTGLLESAGATIIVTWSVTQRRAFATALRREDSAFKASTRAAHPDPADLFRHHHAFHQHLATRTATPVARELLRTLEPRVARYEWFHGPLLQQAGLPFTPTLDEHDAILVAVRDGTARAIERTLRTNWDHAAERLVLALDHAMAQTPRRRRR